MVELDFGDEEEMFRREIRNFARKELSAGADERAETGRMPEELIKKMADIGLLGINVPAQYGGQPADWIMTGIMTEELAKVDSLAAHLAGLSTVTSMALEWGSEEARQEWIPQLVSGKKLACLAMTEPNAGSDVTAIKTRAVKKGNWYILNGEKNPVTCGRQAGIAIVDANTSLEAGAKKISCFLVPLDTPGVNKFDMPYMSNSEGLASIVLEDVRIPDSYLLGEENKGLRIVIGELDVTRIWAGLIALAMAQASLNDATNYAGQRVAFDKPIGKFQGVAFKIAEGVARVEAARLLCYRALRLKDKGLPFIKEAAMAKLFATEVAVGVIHDALVIHGHYGFSSEYPIERRLRDAIGEELASGTQEMMKVIICQYILGKEFILI